MAEIEDGEEVVARPGDDAEPPEETVEEREEREHQEALVFREKWQKKRKHIFVFSDAGKPIFSRHGDESDISDFFGVMQVLVSFVQDSQDTIHRLVAGKHQFVFSFHGPLYFVMVSSTSEPFASLQQQLDSLHDQISFHLTNASITRIFKKQANYDLRNLLGGTDLEVRNLVRQMNNDPAHFLGATQCLPLPRTIRAQIGEVMRDMHQEKQLFALLLAGNFVVQVVTPYKEQLHPADILLLMNYINSSKPIQDAANFSPICLPHFNDQGMIYAFIDFIARVSPGVGVCLVLISASPSTERFSEFMGVRDAIVDQLEQRGILPMVVEKLRNPHYTAADIGAPDLRHMLFKLPSSVFTATAYSPPYSFDRKQQKRLLRLYSVLRSRAHAAKARERMYFHNTFTECTLCWATKDFELLATFNPLTPKPNVIAGAWKIRKWVKATEDTLFLSTPMYFP